MVLLKPVLFNCLCYHMPIGLSIVQPWTVFLLSAFKKFCFAHYHTKLMQFNIKAPSPLVPLRSCTKPASVIPTSSSSSGCTETTAAGGSGSSAMINRRVRRNSSSSLIVNNARKTMGTTATTTTTVSSVLTTSTNSSGPRNKPKHTVTFVPGSTQIPPSFSRTAKGKYRTTESRIRVVVMELF